MPGKPKGLPKTGGRTAGTPNKLTGDMKEIIQGAIEQRLPRIIEVMDRVDDPEFIKIILSLLEYVLPKLQRSEIKAEVRTEITDSIMKAFEGVEDQPENEAIQP